MQAMVQFLRDQNGGTAMEYGFVLALVSLAGLTALGPISNSLDNLFNGISSNLEDAVS